ncbi:MAG TPA: cohesin domain-containing protein [Patescibacteria group bacterium]|nr:cohesin domain-containing protein [Patescibacteria group bacterium]
MNKLQTYWLKIKEYFNNPANSNEKNKVVLGLTVLCAIILLLFIGSLINVKKTASPVAQLPTPTPTNHTVLAFTPAMQFGYTQISTTANTNEYDLPIFIQSGENNISGVQLHLNYDPKIFTNVSVKPGDYLKNANTPLINNIDTKKGEINYAVGILPKTQPSQGSGVFATLILHLNPTFQVTDKPITTVIGFLPGTAIGDQAYHYTSLQAAYGETITITK